MSKFACNNINYAAGKLDARQQFHIVRRLAPFLSGLLPTIGKIQGKSVADISTDEMMAVLPSIADALAAMDDETADYVIFGLLKVVTREQGQGLGWAPVAINQQLMFQDIDMAQMLTLATRALMANLGSFFAVLNSASNQVGQKPNGQ